ncbi:hypothetical protein HLB44_25350 [Aquincola sp. S2]|uniref:PEP-CTERM sorting domain-containing protein n=1 Tax=Pseudaquabacterium terrae TaxID=2732868 RepID=A0ABX2ENW7_9BURK|nr:hypothetical protein [Aquabacterium terrae]NRF70340.1 hypothetical protein [Aquabacterium terrae]
MYLYPQGRSRSPCPACGSEIRRVRRREADRAAVYAGAWRRYGCSAAGCDWQGMLPRQPSRTSTAHPSLWSRGRAVATGTLRRGWPLLLAAGALALLSFGSLPERPQASGAAAAPLLPGEHHEGVEIAPQHPLLAAAGPAAPQVQPLGLRQGCAWGLPGRNPYRGSVEQALVSAKLPAEVVQRIAHKVKAGALDDRVTIGNAAIRTQRDQREFEPRNVAMTYGRTLCVNTRVNFKPGHVEHASLYEAADKRGKLYSVMVPDVCGNVSVLGARMERRRKKAEPLPALALAAGGDVPVLAEVAHDAPEVLHMLVSDGLRPARELPEPSTLACVLAALGCGGVIGLWARRRREARAAGDR